LTIEEPGQKVPGPNNLDQ